jgi:membrane protein DedA with SNARE-associated domain
MAFLAGLTDFVAGVIAAMGYPGVFVLMAMESFITPVPSTLVMGFAGYLVWRGDFLFPLVVIAATMGSMVGSLAGYAIGKYGGRPLVERHGRWFLLTNRDLARTDAFFTRWGAYAVFLARFVPVVRHVISIPAGAASMPMGRFLLATALGAGAWNAFLAWVGMGLGPRWHETLGILEPYEYAAVAVLGVAVVVVVAHRVRAMRSEQPVEAPPGP